MVGKDALGVREALFLTTYSRDLTLIHLGAPQALPSKERESLSRAGVVLIETPDVGGLRLEAGQVRVALGAEVHLFDTVYSALGVQPRSHLAGQAGALLAEDGRLIVDDHQQTSLPGLYAAGDLVRGLNQISTAEAEAAIAATAIHNGLREAEQP